MTQLVEEALSPAAPNTLPSYHSRVRRLARNRLALVGALILAVLILASAAAPWLAPEGPEKAEPYKRFAPPGTPGHLLGTDELGRDVLARVLHGGRVSLSIGFTTGILMVLIGTSVGAAAGFHDGWVDQLLMRFTDLMLTFPSLLLLLVLAVMFGSTPGGIVLIIGVSSWMPVARIVRAEFLAVKELEFVEAARASGANDLRLIFRQILPNTVSSIIVATTLGVAQAILTESALSFLGYGIQPPLPSWGNMLESAQSVIQFAPWLGVTPGLLIVATVLSLNFLGDGLRDAFDSRIVNRA